MSKSLKSFINRFTDHLATRIRQTPSTQDVDALMLLGALHTDRVKQLPANAPLRDVEFKVFSQFGDDGIIQYLIHRLAITPDSFIEFGVEDYAESNTRFLLMQNNWRGLVIDGSTEQIAKLTRERIYWRHDLTAVAAFITTENINDLFRQHGYAGDIGVLSIDIDGNDYWVFEAIDCVQPTLIICEYNSVFGSEHAITIPYDPAFQRTKAHYSNLYWGASLGALTLVAQKKGYALVGCNSAGNNAYFIRKDRLGPFTEQTIREAYVESRYRESRNPEGGKTFVNGQMRREIIQDLSVVDVVTGKTETIRNLFKSL